MKRIMTEHDKTLTNTEKAVIDKALLLLRDRHNRNYFKSSNLKGEVALNQRRIALSIDQLRGKVFDL